MIKQIGCFHFMAEYHNPFIALRSSLSNHGDVGGSLIVLPEAFNKGSSYYERPGGEPLFQASSMLQELQGLAVELNLVIVVGLLVPPLSSGFLIDAVGVYPTGSKRSADSSGNYSPVPDARQDGLNPPEYDGIGIGVLLCNEIDFHADGLSARLAAGKNARNIICIPACMSAHYFGDGRLTSDHWRGNYVVLANSNLGGCGSFIANTKGERTMVRSDANELILKTWAELDFEIQPF